MGAFRWVPALALLLAAAPEAAVRADDGTLAPGSVVAGVLRVAGKQVPLPEGPWVVAGAGHEGWEGPSPGAYGAIANLVLFRLVGDVVDAAVELNVNELPVADGWGVAADCARTDLALAVIRYRTGWDGSCFFVSHTLAVTSRPPAAWRRALRFVVDAELVVSPLWLSAGFRVSNRRDVIDVRFHFSPTTRGVPVEAPARWMDSAWHGERLAADPRRSALAAEVAGWAGRYGSLLEAGLKNRLGSASVPPMPGARAPARGEGELARRLATLAAMRDEGTIDERQFRVQASFLRERGLQPGSATVDPGDAALAKALTFQPLVATGSLAMWLVGLGPVAAPGLAAAARAGLDAAVFYLHELGWERWARQPRRDSARIVDFRYFGSRA